MTLSARRLASLAGSQSSYAEADGLLRELSGLNFGAKRIERTTRAAGDDLEAWRADAETRAEAEAGGEVSLAREAPKPGRKLCCAVDGTGVPALPSETAGRSGKDGGRAGTREAKVGALWVSETDAEGRPRMVEGTEVLLAAIESAAETPGEESPFERRLLRELAAAGCAPRDVEVCVGDGAEWIRRVFDDWFPGAEKIVDYYHATEYLWAAARARHGDGDLAKAWAKKLCAMLKAGRLDAALDDLRKRGMRWSVAGANPVLWLRCARLGGWLDDYWDHRVARLAA